MTAPSTCPVCHRPRVPAGEDGRRTDFGQEVCWGTGGGACIGLALERERTRADRAEEALRSAVAEGRRAGLEEAAREIEAARATLVRAEAGPGFLRGIEFAKPPARQGGHQGGDMSTTDDRVRAAHEWHEFVASALKNAERRGAVEALTRARDAQCPDCRAGRALDPENPKQHRYPVRWTFKDDGTTATGTHADECRAVEICALLAEYQGADTATGEKGGGQ